MNRKNKKEYVREYLKSKSLVSTSQLQEMGVENIYLTQMVRDGEIERVARGFYMKPGSIKDGLFILQSQNKKIIFSHHTSLYLWDMTTRDPFNISITVPTGYNSTSLLKKKVKVYSVKKGLFDLGKTELNTQLGNKIYLYNRERTVCDLLRNRKQIEENLINEGIRNYFNMKKKDLPKLYRYAKKFRLTNVLKNRVGVLL